MIRLWCFIAAKRTQPSLAAARPNLHTVTKLYCDIVVILKQIIYRPWQPNNKQSNLVAYTARICFCINLPLIIDMKINHFLQITLHYLLGETVFKFHCHFSFHQRLGGVQDSDHSIYEMIKKKMKKWTEKKFCDGFVFYFALALHSSSGWNTICIGERIKIIYEYI